MLLAGFFVFWPLAWTATLRIARPVARLARVAGALQEGQLAKRIEIPSGQADEVGEVADALRTMADRVVGQLDDQKALLAAVSHELRSPLGRLRVLAELAREERAPADLHDRIQREIDGMDALVGDLLAASRIDFEALQPLSIDPETLASQALEAARLPSSLLEAPDDLPTLRADATLLLRALRGLLDNAERHGGGPVRLALSQDEETLVFEVDDDGPGFQAGQEEQVFEPFWRGTPAEGRRPPGTGLGLALVRRIAEAHNGTADARNRPGGGATVRLVLPLP